MGIRYSVIIPAYNAEKTIRRCLDSLVSIIRDDVELLVINDGSGDRTGEICQEYVERYSNVRYFYKENGGVSSARNMGLDEATGEYILFVDSDDFVTEEYFGISDNVTRTQPDFVLFGRYIYNGKRLIPHTTGMRDQITETSEATAELLSRALEKQLLNAPSSKIFKRNIIEKNAIRFDERLPIGEDKVFVVQYIMHASTALTADQPVYALSVENGESLSRKKRKNLSEYILLEHELLFQAVREADMEGTCKGKYREALTYSYYRSAYTVIAELQKMDLSPKQRIQEIKKICMKYNRRIRCRLSTLKIIVLALPVRLCMCRIIDYMLKKKTG